MRIATHKEVDKLLREIRKLGYTWRSDGNSHFAIYKPDGTPLRWDNGAPVTLPSSPGNRHAIGTMRVKLIKAGVPLNPRQPGPKTANQEMLRQRVHDFLGDTQRGDRSVFVHLALETAQERGIPIPYGKTTRGRRTRLEGIDGEKALYETTRASFYNFIRGVSGLTATNERFWNAVLDVLEGKTDEPEVAPVQSQDRTTIPASQEVAEQAESAPATDTGELVLRVVTLAALTDPQHHMQVVHQASELIRHLLQER